MKRGLLFVLAVVVLSLVFVPLALAASPQDIYNDYEDNSKLDSNYTNAELQAYLNDGTIHQYGDSTITDPLDRLVTKLLEPSDGSERSEFPFTGFEIAAGVAAAVVLIGGGFLLRRSARSER